jgi:hypothetical protein
MQGVHFSLSGHTLGLSDRKLVPMLREVRGLRMHSSCRVFICIMGCARQQQMHTDNPGKLNACLPA